MKSLTALMAVLALLLLRSAPAWSHCQMPCGIYDDHMRIHMIEEYITTIEKGMNQIVALQAATEKDYNQLVRWINTKEEHASQLQELVSDYWMTQRIKPVGESDPKYKKYQSELEMLHKMLTEAMKCRQTTDLEHVKNLRSLLADFEKSYFEGM